ncbi:hypothetical protein EXIGLDRAFT_775106 [Exidia glandulosa HHB12029]|uniref:Uncharacterized protein n=1 Tax=Exidia glandulosa HHB12029 TaxID=1314781 RepID=A0A165E2B5_EXIGL|nr:hypothetical protein EXIGLDRAFT_775106 [Exidia glandulosa HHB12029]
MTINVAMAPSGPVGLYVGCVLAFLVLVAAAGVYLLWQRRRRSRLDHMRDDDDAFIMHTPIEPHDMEARRLLKHELTDREQEKESFVETRGTSASGHERNMTREPGHTRGAGSDASVATLV